MEPGARALLHANQPSLRLPAALSSSSRPPSSALPPPACGAPSFPAGPPPPAACSLAFPRVLPAGGKWNPATAIASLSGRGSPRSPPQAPVSGPGRTRSEHRPCWCAPGAGLTEGPRSRFQVFEKKPGNIHSLGHLLSAGGLHALGS